jgi:hypothetical protein
MSTSSTNLNRHRILRSLVAPFLGAAAVSVSMFAPAEANAWWTRTSGTICNPSSGVTDNATCNTSTASGRHFVCAVPDTSATPKTAIQQLNVHVTESNPNSNTTVMRCVQFRDAIGGVCGNFAATTTTGTQNVQPPTLPEWGLTNNYGHIFIALAPKTANTTSCIQGFLTSDSP